MRVLLIAASVTVMAGACSTEESAPTAEPAAEAAPVTPIAAVATDAAGAEAFLRQHALARYASLTANEAAQQDETMRAEMGTPAQLQRLFTPELAETLNRAYNAEGGLDADPICLCNDDSAMVIHSIQSAPQADGRVQSTVSFDSRDVSGKNYPAILTYTLERTPAGWRIADVSDQGVREGSPSLLESLSRQ